MGRLTPFTSVFRAHPAPDGHKVVKRSRQAVSCSHCRSRKLKCDKQQPCGSCTRRGQTECTYAIAGADARKDSQRRTLSRTLSDISLSGGQPPKQHEAQLRLQNLERMVQEFVGAGALESRTLATDAGPGPVVEARHPAPDPMPMEADAVATPAGEKMYHGATHWATFLEHIREIQVVLSAEASEDVASSGSPVQCCAQDSPDLLFGGVAAIDMDGVLDSLPSRQDTDVLVGTYFNARYTAVPFIHVRHFQKEYEAFWANPRSGEFLWISMLFAIMSTAAIVIKSKSLEQTLTMELQSPAFYNKKAAECLVAGGYLKNKKYAIEALLLHAHTSNVGSRDSDSVLWATIGLATRLAQRSGYHRDPEHLPRRIPPFEAEMRRRVWFFVETFDTLLSFQLGMPPIVHGGECDTKEPGNHPDDDFDDTTIVMPAPRPPLDATPILYYSHKARICRVLRKVVQHVLSIERNSHDNTRALHAELASWKAELPACLRIDTIRACSFADEPCTIMHKLLLDLMYCNALCVLYRAYLSHNRQEPAYEACRQTCREAALRMLNLQFEFDTETKPGGRLFQDRWMLSSLTLHNFKIAAMVLCLDLSEAKDKGIGGDREGTIETLRTAKSIWSERASSSQDASRASVVLGAMLRRLAAEELENSPSGASDPTSTSGSWSESTLDGMSDLVWPLDAVQAQDLAMWPYGPDDFSSLDNGLYNFESPRSG